MNRCLPALIGLQMLLSCCSPLQAQRKTDLSAHPGQPAAISVRTGFTLLYGDLEDLASAPFLGVSLLVPVTQIFTVELPAEIGTLKSRQTGFYHSQSKARFFQTALVVSADFLKVLGKGHKRVEIRPYAGGGLLFFSAEARHLTTGNLQRQTNNRFSHRSRDGLEARGKAGIKRTHEWVWPLGIRTSTALSRRASVFGDLRLNLVRTDKLDATRDDDNRTMPAPESSPAFTEGNHYGKNSADKWAYLSVGINFYFGDRFK
ncbi:hypothetical protein [Larkinella soli]|uniref:hypothetical protein n=1 Tax=Larkinella soli TaxID=1770527 RepID=UPI000FFB0A86|nr:hypothetical protein [Larkinella soli]